MRKQIKLIIWLRDKFIEQLENMDFYTNEEVRQEYIFI